ncbi:UNVERIFIED_CONTAM: hypothetical protein HDU68_008513 [Siphonaria sp. JEL0065]|nr:hypothetical protein HDU68_008513 [Siphonaria sp. JEL0065]
MSLKTSSKKTQSAIEAQWNEKMRIKSELSKRIKARLMFKGGAEEGDRFAHIDDSEDENGDQVEDGGYELDDEIDMRSLNQQFQVQDQEYYSQQQPSESSQLPPIICEQPPTPPTMSLPLSYRENLDWMDQHYNRHQSFGYPGQQPQFYYPTTSVPPLSASVTQPLPHYPMHTVVVYQYGPPPPAPFMTDTLFHQQVYPTPQHQQQPYFAQNHTLYMPQQHHQQYPPLPSPIPTTTIGPLSSTLTRSPQFPHSPAVWLGPCQPTSQSITSGMEITNSDATISGLLKPDDGVKIISRSSSSISIGALIDPPGGCENSIFGLQAL